MSKHWNPGGSVAPIGPRQRGRWARVQTYLPGAGASRPWPAARMLLGAAIAGVALGAAVSFTGTGPEPVCTASGAPTMVLPFEQADPADAEWERRADISAEAVASPGAVAVGRARFGLCHSGGGSNCVVDGDTFYLRGDKVRIAGIDAPKRTRRAANMKRSWASKRPSGCASCSIRAR